MSNDACFATLPVELLLEIVQFVLRDSQSYKDLFSLSQVESRLRAAIIGCPYLWSFLWIDHTVPSFELTRLALSRSNGRNLKIGIIIMDSNLKSGFGLQLLQFLASTPTNSIQKLSITHPGNSLTAREQYARHCIGALDTSILEELEIKGPSSQWEEEPQSDSLVLPPMPRLRRLTLEGVMPEWPDRVPMETLAYMSFANPGFDISLVDIRRMLQLSPNIQELRFDGTALGDWESPPPAMKLPNLLHLVLGVGDAFMLSFLQGMDAPLLETISLIHSRPLTRDELDFEDAAECQARHRSVRHLEIQTTSDGRFNNYATYLLPQVFPNIETIIIPAASCGFLSDVMHHKTWKIWPRLQTLTVVGVPYPDKDWYQAVDSLNTFAVLRQQTFQRYAEPWSALSIVIQSTDDVSEEALFLIEEETIQFVEMYQLGERILAGEIDADEAEL